MMSNTPLLPNEPASVAAFLEKLESVPWFSNLGHPSGDSGVQQIGRWEDWPGPEHPLVHELFDRQQTVYDAIMDKAGDHKPQLSALWNQIHATIFRLATPAVPYDPSEDAWHGPTTAVWHAAWVAGIVGLCLASARPIPEEVREQWQWFDRGHWPCGYATGDEDQPGKLLVY